MNRREMVLAVISSAVMAGVAGHSVARNADEPAMFLHDLYSRETERHNNRRPADNDAFYAMFSRELRELMQAPRRTDLREPAGPILNALFGRGILPGTQVILSRVTTMRSDDGIAMLDVTLTVRDQLRDLAVVLLRQEGAWKINEIAYDGPDTLTAYYRHITGRQ